MLNIGNIPVSIKPVSIQVFWRVLGALLLGGLLARWTWLLLAPNTAVVMPLAPPASGVQAERLFGVAVSAVTPQAALPDVKLVGVFAGHPGFAVLELDGKRQMGLAAGGDVVAGVKLIEVAFDHVILERDGVRHRILLEEKSATVTGAASAQSVAQPILLQSVVQEAAGVVVPSASAVSGANAIRRMPNFRGGM